MISVTVTDLKAHLSRYLRLVRRGSEVQVTDRGLPVARLVGLGESLGGPADGRIAKLTELGILRRGSGNLRWLLDQPVISTEPADLNTALAEDREDRT